MKKLLALLLALLCVLPLCACGRDMNWVISNEPSVRGIVEEIGEDYVLIRVNEADEIPHAVGGVARVDKETRLQDCKFAAQLGDEVAVYYDGGSERNEALTGNPEIHDVHGYVIITPANREKEQMP